MYVSVKKTTAAPRTLAGQIKAGSFLSSSARFAPPRDVLIKESDPLVPGLFIYCYMKEDCLNHISDTKSLF